MDWMGLNLKQVKIFHNFFNLIQSISDRNNGTSPNRYICRYHRSISILPGILFVIANVVILFILIRYNFLPFHIIVCDIGELKHAIFLPFYATSDGMEV